jgi:hypothetical protein
MIDFRKIGRKMSRRRDERGWVEKVGKIQRMWEGYFNVYVRMADGTEKRRRRSRILGPCAEMTKNDALDELRKIILRERGRYVGCRYTGRSSGRATESNFCGYLAALSNAEGIQLVECKPKSGGQRF